MVKRVIIIDDDPISILVTETMIRKNDFAEKVDSFEKPSEALVFLRSEYPWDIGCPDFIFLDVQMPNIDAWDFMDSYRDIHSCILEKKHIILLSATANPEDEARARDHAMVRELVTKPVNGRLLERLI